MLLPLLLNNLLGTGVSGSGAIAEGYDTVHGAGPLAGIGAIVEAADAVGPAPPNTITGSGAILEAPDDVLVPGFGDVPDPYSWKDYKSNIPPAGYVGLTYQYRSSLKVSSGDTTVPYTYLGPYRSAIMEVPWQYIPNGADLGAALNVSLDGGVSWVVNSIAPAAGGQSLSGSIYVDLTGATQVQVKVTRIMNTLGGVPMLTQNNAPLEM